MGVVYEATDRSLERRVAVKKMRDEIRADPHERRRFVNEAKVVAALRHPNIVDIYAIVEEGDEVYLVFEYVTGRTLADTIKADGPMSPEAARGVLAAATGAVEHAHAAQVVHRDLKPSNIMITEDGRVKVMDFGVARQAKDAITKMSMTNTVVGTPPYMAPEQEQGTVRRESDVFALGVCLYEMLTGQLPFQGGGGDAAQQDQRQAHSSVPAEPGPAGRPRRGSRQGARPGPRQALQHAHRAPARARRGHRRRLTRFTALFRAVKSSVKRAVSP
ncbi:MAG: serine/threonine protein kinase [Elusimicrobiota bacterium]|nr:MAG: serine/threonine protein kinase [Elusimicrobiota bacterium]